MYETLGGDMTHKAFRQRIVKTGDKHILRHVTVIEILPNDIAFCCRLNSLKTIEKIYRFQTLPSRTNPGSRGKSVAKQRIRSSLNTFS